MSDEFGWSSRARRATAFSFVVTAENGQDSGKVAFQDDIKRVKLDGLPAQDQRFFGAVLIGAQNRECVLDARILLRRFAGAR